MPLRKESDEASSDGDRSDRASVPQERHANGTAVSHDFGERKHLIIRVGKNVGDLLDDAADKGPARDIATIGLLRKLGTNRFDSLGRNAVMGNRM